MTTSPNFGWTIPADTDLVKDGAAAIRTALNGVDTSFVDLKGGTTGQVLSKTSGTDLDFTWITDATGMANPMTTTGDVIYSSSGSTPARLGIGSTDDVLTVAGGVPTWAAPAGGGKVLQVVSFVTNSLNTSTSSTLVDTSLTLSITPTSATSKVLAIVSQNGIAKSNSSADAMVAALELHRGATLLARMGNSMLWTNTAMYLYGLSATISYLDSPATTSATTYKTKYSGVSGASVSLQTGSVHSSITLIEIGA
jgi:hypothetical protein